MDAISKTVLWLKHYRAWKAFAQHTGDRIRELMQELNLSPAPGAVRYDRLPGGGQGDSMEEKHLERQQELREMIEDLKSRSRMARNSTTLIELAISSLSPADKDLITYRAMDGMTWTATAIRCGYSESYCRRRCKIITKELAFILFGTMDEQKEKP